MGTKKKLFLFLLGFAVLACASLASALLFYYYRPAKTKAIVEESISKMTATVCTIEKLSYSVRPLEIRAKGVVLVGHVQGFLMEIPELSAGLALRGPLGQKTLTVTHLRINGFSLTVHQDTTLAKIREPEESFPHLGRALKTLLSYLLFREISIEAMKVSEGHVAATFDDTKITLNSLRGGITTNRILEVACEAKVERLSHKMVLLAPEIFLNTDPMLALVGPEIRGALKVPKARLEHPEIKLGDFTIESKLVYDRENAFLTMQPLAINFNEILLHKFQRAGHASLKGNLLTTARLDLSRRQMAAPGFHLLLQSMLELRGSLDVVGVKGMQLLLRDLDGHFMPEKVEPLVPDSVKKTMAPFQVTGPVGFRGDMTIFTEEGGESFDMDLEVRLEGNEISYATPPLFSHANVTGSLLAIGKFPDIRTSVRLSCKPISFKNEWFDFKGGSLDLSLAGKHPVFEIQKALMKVPEARVRAYMADVLLHDISSQLEAGIVDFEKGTFTFPDVEIQTSLLRNLRLTVKRDEQETTLAVLGKDIQMLNSARTLKWMPPEWQLSGLESLHASLTLQDAGEWKALSEIQLEGSRFENAGLDWAGENLSIAWTLEAGGHSGGSSGSWRTSFAVTKGEMLLDRFYADMGKNSFSLRGSGVYDDAQKSFQMSDLQMGLKDILTLSLQGTLSYSSLARSSPLKIEIPKTELQPIFRQFVVEPFRREKAFLSSFNVEGNISADLEVRHHRDEFTIKGRCLWNEGGIEALDKGFSIKGIHLDFPLWFRLAVTDEKAGSPGKPGERSVRARVPVREEPVRGILKIQSAAFPMLPTQPLMFYLDARPNQISSPFSTPMKVPGGEIEWGPFVLNDFLFSDFSLVTSLRMREVQLDPILTEAWKRPLQGTARGQLDPIEISGDEIRSKGKIEVGLFGGNLSITNPGAYGIFSITPVFSLDAHWEGLLLGELTEGTSFGKVEGVLRGHAKGLQIAGGEPQKFDLLMETVPREGVSQTISTRAVDNISQIGGGQSALTGVFASFFKEFPYEKIGIRASLENDLFRINGTIKEEGKEYLVKRGGFSGVNVVNQNPENVISFKDMVKRVKRVADSEKEVIVH